LSTKILKEAINMSVIADVAKDENYLQIKALVDKGAFLTAFNQAQAVWGAYQQWTTLPRLKLLCRMFESLGMERTAKAIRLNNWRRFKTDHQSALSVAFLGSDFSG
jgi:hypothetical protein